MADTANTVYRDFVTDGIPASGKHDPYKPDIRRLLTGYETIINAFLSNGGLIYSSKAAMDADLAKAANTMAWVVGDATAANNGIYRKSGGSGSGSWLRAADLPFSFIVASDVGAGTPNAILATTSIPVTSSAFVILAIFEANTESPVTVSFNGGSLLTVLSSSGRPIKGGDLKAGMVVGGFVSGSNFRLLNEFGAQFVSATNTGGANAITATTPYPIPNGTGEALVLLPIINTNTGPATVSFNGGAALAIKTNSGNDVAPGGLVAGMIVLGIVSGSTFRLVSDQVSSAIVAQAEDSATLAQAWAEGTLPGGPGTLSSKEWAELAETTFETNAAAVIPSVQRFAVGGVVQSIDTGKPGLVAASARVFIDGVYQFSNTWGIAAGIITPVGGTWPGDGVVENMEVIVDATSSIAFNVPSDGSVDENKLTTELAAKLPTAQSLQTNLPFGHAGIRVLRGEKYDAHYGLPSSPITFASGKKAVVYRKAPSHSIKDGAEVRMAFSYDGGETYDDDILLYQNALSDARPDMIRHFASGRSGFMVNRQDEGSTHFSPLLVYSDDEFVTWSTKELTLPSPYTFQSNGGIMDFPASQGGHDTMGFIAFGFVTGGSYGRISTADNWETFAVSGGIAALTHAPATGTPITNLSEWSGGRIGNEDKWIFYLRCQDAGGWRDEAACFVTTNLLNWGAAVPSNINLGGNPPCIISDPDTGLFHLIGFGRGGRGIDGFDHHMLIASADADALWSANGDWAALGLGWSIIAPVPNWATGYMGFAKDGDHWTATFACGEPGAAGGDRSLLAMIGNFVPSSTDESKWQEAFRWNAIFKTLRAGFASTVTPPADAFISAGVDSVSAGFLSYNGGTTTRTHWTIRNANGEIGKVEAGGSSTSFVTTSDGQLKADQIPLGIDAGAIMDALQLKAWNWLNDKGEKTGEQGLGLVAQEVYELAPWAVSVGHGKPGDSDYRAWGLDMAKLVIPLIAEVKALRGRIAAIEGDK